MSQNIHRTNFGSKNAMIQLRINAEQKAIIERAAALSGTSVSSYMLSHSQKVAEQEIASHERLLLSKEDWGLFITTIENPPKPNQALKKAAKSFKKKYSTDVCYVCQ